MLNNQRVYGPTFNSGAFPAQKIPELGDLIDLIPLGNHDKSPWILSFPMLDKPFIPLGSRHAVGTRDVLHEFMSSQTLPRVGSKKHLKYKPPKVGQNFLPTGAHLQVTKYSGGETSTTDFNTRIVNKDHVHEKK